MSRERWSRSVAVEDKLRILEEARHQGTMVAEVLRRHQIDPTTLYRWDKQAKAGMREALAGRIRENGNAPEKKRTWS